MFVCAGEGSLEGTTVPENWVFIFRYKQTTKNLGLHWIIEKHIKYNTHKYKKDDHLYDLGNTKTLGISFCMTLEKPLMLLKSKEILKNIRTVRAF